MTAPRKGQFEGRFDRESFRERFLSDFAHPAFDAVRDALAAVEAVAWDNYLHERKPGLTEKAGPGFVDPGYDLSVEWRQARDRLVEAEAQQKNPATPPRILLVCASHRNDGSCPGEISKTWRLAKVAEETLDQAGIVTDLLDLSRLISEPALRIHPCKGCVSTAMPLCHWPCSCYPNHSLRQTNDWMNDIYEHWVSAHGVILFTPTYWYQAPSSLKLMMDRLVCADGGNPDPTSTHGKNAAMAKDIEEKGWDYPKHLAGRAYGLVVHGDVDGIEGTRRSLADWLDWMGLIDAGALSRVNRYVGYYEPYATSHEALDRDAAFIEETRNVARAVANAVSRLRAGELSPPDAGLQAVRPK